MNRANNLKRHLLGVAMDKSNEQDKVYSAHEITQELLEGISPEQTIVICANQPIPSGFVIIAAGSSMSCPGWSATGTNTFTIKRPGNQEVVCSNSPIPAGYVIIAAGSSMGCTGWSATGTNTFTIKIPGQQETVCGNSPIPAGYVVIGTGSSMGCPGWSATGSNTKTIRRV